MRLLDQGKEPRCSSRYPLTPPVPLATPKLTIIELL
jgi:hypothetical protein